MMSKQDQILEKVSETQIDVATIKEHLKALNGTVARHEKHDSETDMKINTINRKLAYYAGGIAALVFAAGLINYII